MIKIFVQQIYVYTKKVTVVFFNFKINPSDESEMNFFFNSCGYREG